MYSLKIEANELNVTKVLNRINSEFNLKLTEAEIDSKEIADGRCDTIEMWLQRRWYLEHQPYL